MLFGRLVGWMLIGLAVIMASADAVMALGPAEYAGIITADVVTLLTGGEPEVGNSMSLLASAEELLLDMPAWMVMGPLGTLLLMLSRKRHRRYRFRRG
jgi:hypothetical protein